MIKPATVDAVFSALRIEEVLSDFLTLKKRGVNYLACCPFHDEKTPSFTISPAKEIYKCFGCGVSGNAVKFLMEYEKCSYPEALEYIARKYNIFIEYEEVSEEKKQERSERERVLEANKIATDFFSSTLLEKENNVPNYALQYALERGLNYSTIQTFQIGYNSEKPEKSLQEHIQKENHEEIPFIEGGLLVSATGRKYDKFYGRLIFPIQNHSGRVIGFGGRLLQNSDKRPKYLNSPDSVVYNKSNVLYGIFQAKESILKKDECFLVEGYMDVLALYQAGIKNVVATCGTSLTVEQSTIISRFTKKVTIIYDSDEAGKKATLKAIDILLEKQLNVLVVSFPEGEDPDSFAKSNGSEKTEEFIKEKRNDFFSWKMSRFEREKVLSDPYYKTEVIETMLSAISKIEDTVVVQAFLKKLSEELDANENTLNSLLLQKKMLSRGEKELPQKQPQTRLFQPQEQKDDAKILEDRRYWAERELVRLLLKYRTHILKFPTDDEIEEISVGAFFVNELEAGEISIQTEELGVIYEYVQKVEKGEQEFDESVFSRHQNPKVVEVYADISTSKYTFSSGWETLGYYTEKEEQSLKKCCKKLILSLHLIENKEKIEKIKEKMKECTPESEEVIQKMNEIIVLTNTRKELSKMLDRVIIY